MDHEGATGNSAVYSSTVYGDVMLNQDAPSMCIRLAKAGDNKKADEPEVLEISPFMSTIVHTTKKQSLSSDSCIQVEIHRQAEDATQPAPRLGRNAKRANCFCDFEALSFTNCRDLIDAIAFVGPIDLTDGDGKRLLIAVSGLDTSTYNPGSSDSLSYLQLYEMVLKPDVAKKEKKDAMSSLVTIWKPRLLKIYPLQGERYVDLYWLSSSNFPSISNPTSSNHLLLLALTEQGSVLIFTIGKNEDLSVQGVNMPKVLHILWRYDPSGIISHQQLTCVSVSYCTDRTELTEGCDKDVIDNEELSGHSCKLPQEKWVLTVAAGTNDGFLLVWKFMWQSLCDAAENLGADTSNEGASPIFHKMIPISTSHQDVPLASRIVSVDFLPLPESHVMAIATDIGQGILEGEITTYNMHKYLTAVRFTKDLNYVIAGAQCVMCIEWTRKTMLSSLSYDSWKTVQYMGAFGNLCWDIAVDGKYAYFVYDDGLLVTAPISAFNKRTPQDLGTTYLWESTIKDGKEIEAENGASDEAETISKVAELASEQFKNDLEYIRTNGICITRNGSQHRKGRPAQRREKRIIRNKVLSHHCVRAIEAQLDGMKLYIAGYGGNAGILQLIIRN